MGMVLLYEAQDVILSSKCVVGIDAIGIVQSRDVYARWMVGVR